MKKETKIYFIYTEGNDLDKGSKDIYRCLEETLSQKENLIFDSICVEKSNEYSIRKKLNAHIERNIKESVNAIIELNFTGGTKVMSSVAYQTFKEYSKKYPQNQVILSYIDGEKKSYIYEEIKGEKIKYGDKELKAISTPYNISIKDIIESHGLSLKQKNKIEDKKYLALSTQIFNLFSISKNDLEEVIKNLGDLYKISYECADAIKGVKEEFDYKTFMKEDEVARKLQKYYSMILKDEELLNLDIRSKNAMNRLLKVFRGDWLEEYILNILNEFKEENLIDEVKHSIERKGAQFEIDFVVYKDYKLYGISVTTCDEFDDNLLKLHEIITRGKQFGGEQCDSIYINLYKDEEELRRYALGLRENSDSDKINILCRDKFPCLKEELRKIFLKGDK